jgi:hypothetical protein
MQAETQQMPRRDALLDTGEALPLPRPRSGRGSLRAEARKRRIMANVAFFTGSVAVVAVAGICYALLSH